MKFKKYVALLAILGIMFLNVPIYAADETVLGNNRWSVETDGDLVPKADSSYDLGASGTEVSTLYVDTIVIGGDSVSGANQLTNPMEDAGTYIRGIDAADNIKLYDNGAITAVGAVTAGSFVMDNGAVFDNAADTYVTLVENDDTLTLNFTGDDVSIDVSDGGIIFALTDATDGTFDLYLNNVSTDYLSFSQGTNQATITATGTGNDLYLAAAGGDINCADENITTTGAISCGSITGFTSMTLTDDVLNRSADDVLQWASNDEASTFYILGYTGKDALLWMASDLAADPGDTWQLEADYTTNSLIMSNNTSGSQVAKLTLSTSGNATLGGSRITFAESEYISNSTDDTVQIASNDSSVILDIYSPNTSDGTVSITMVGDAGANATDRWRIQNPADGTLTVANDSAAAGTYVTKLTIAGSDGDITTTGDVEIVDDMDLVFGSGAEWKVQYDEGVDDQLIFITAGTGCTATTDPMFEILVGATPTEDQQVFGVAKGTQVTNTALFTIDEDGDTAITGDLAITGNDLTSAGDLLITPAGTEVHINGGLSVGDTTAIGDNNLNVAGTTTLNGAVSVVGATPKVTLGDAGNEDVTLLFDGQSTKDFYIATDNADDSLILGVGSTVGTDSRITIQDNATESRIELGDGEAEDLILVFDGQSDMYIGIDDAGTYPDDLVIGVGAVMATTAGIVIADTTADVTVVPDFTVTGGDITFSSATASKPAFIIQSDVVGTTSSVTTYKHTRGGVDAVDGDDIHTDIYQSYDDGTPTTNDYVTILYEVTDSAIGAEDGNMTISVSSAGGSQNFLELDGVDGIDINAGAVDIDTAIAGNDQTDLFVIDAGNNDIAITRNLAAGATTDSAILTVTQSSATADNGCVSIVNAAGATATDPTVTIQSSATGVVKSSLLINHDGTAGATTEAAVVIDTDDVNTAALYIMSPVTAAGTTSQIDDYALAIVAEGVGGGASIYRNVTGATEALLNVREVHADSTAPLVNINSAADDTADDSVVTIQTSAAAHDTTLLEIINAGVGRGLFVDQNITTGTTLVPAMEIDSQATNGAALIVRAPTTLAGTDADFDDFVMGISAEGVGGGLHVHRDVASTTGSLVLIEDDNVDAATYLLEVRSDQDDTSNTPAVLFATATATCDQPVLQVTQAGVAQSIYALRDVAAATGAVLEIKDDNVDSTGAALKVTTDVDDTGDEAGIQFISTSAAMDEPLITVTSAGAAHALFVDHNLATGTTLKPAFEVDSENVDTAAVIIRSPVDATGTDGDFDDYAVGISVEGIGGGLNIHRDVSASTQALLNVEDDHVDGTSPLAVFQTDQDASGDDDAVQIITTSAAYTMDALSITQAGTGAAIRIVSGALAVDGDSITCDGDLTITPAGDDILVDGGVNIGGTTQAGDNNLIVEGTSQLMLLKTDARTTATETITSADYGETIFFTYAGAVAVTLPAAGATAGSWFRCVNANSDTTAPTYATPVSDNLITFNNATADSVTFEAGHRIGSSVLFISNGSFWIAINENGSCTMTVTDA